MSAISMEEYSFLTEYLGWDEPASTTEEEDGD